MSHPEPQQLERFMRPPQSDGPPRSFLDLDRQQVVRRADDAAGRLRESGRRGRAGPREDDVSRLEACRLAGPARGDLFHHDALFRLGWSGSREERGDGQEAQDQEEHPAAPMRDHHHGSINIARNGEHIREGKHGARSPEQAIAICRGRWLLRLHRRGRRFRFGTIHGPGVSKLRRRSDLPQASYPSPSGFCVELGAGPGSAVHESR